MPPESPDRAAPYRIVVDWGTSSFRAALTARDGRVLDAIETGDGIAGYGRDAFEPLLTERLRPWLERAGALPVILTGMITSRNGWREVPYVSCPVGPAELAQGAHRQTLANGSPLLFIGGVSDAARLPFPDVMRGEETQIVGFGLDRDALLVLPGTHSKWARVEAGRIAGFQTFVTGELFGLLLDHSFIARGRPEPDESPAWDAFETGAAHAAAREPRALLADIFSARTGVLSAALQPGAVADYLSGLLIGHEFRQAREAGWIEPDTGAIGIVGNDRLRERYARVAGFFGLTILAGCADAAIAGALRIADMTREDER